jgi:hypothetical protein
MTKIQAPLIGGKLIEEWDRLWEPVPEGLRRYHPALRHKVGLYRVILGNKISALGTGVSRNGGLAKRLSDFRRRSSSGRRHYAGRLIHERLDELRVEVLVTGADAQAREFALRLKPQMICLHRPTWTVPNAPYTRK